MHTNINQFLSSTKERVEAFLAYVLPTQDDSALANSSIYTATRYAALNDGKRLRPALIYATATALNLNDYAKLDAIAVALELIHCYSLVHDDLPAMDNDDLRRGKPTCHKVFNEATAILTGDALQTLAFEILSDEQLTPFPADTRIKMVNVLAKAAGINGMILGQGEDLAAENKTITLEQLKQLHKHKTGALINAALQLAILAANCDSLEIITALMQYGENIGLAFQVHDDVLDITADTATLGKPAGSDQTNNKSTFPALMGIAEARNYTENLYQTAINILDVFVSNADYLRALAYCFVNRKY